MNFIVLIMAMLISQPKAILPNKVEFFSSETKNFVIYSNDKVKLKHISDNVEFMKERIYSRWNMDNIDFSTKCMIVAINDKGIYKELYKRETAVYDPDFTNKSGTTSQAIWCTVEGDWRDSLLSVKLTEACIRQYGLKNDLNFPKWLIDGISTLNGPQVYIESVLKQGEEMFLAGSHYDGESILKQNTDNESYDKWTTYQNAMLCLYFRKELNVKDISIFCRKNPLLVVKDDLKFDSFEHFSYVFEKYSESAAYDFSHKKMPSGYYLDIFVNKN